MKKTIMIIGAGSGIGLHTPKKFGREGFRAAVQACPAGVDSKFSFIFGIR